MGLIELFWSFFQVGLFTIGGGLASIPLIQNQVVEIHSWLTLSEFTDLIIIAQMTPGPIAINSATFIGMRILGLQGAIIATLGFITPSCMIVSLLAWTYYKYKNLALIEIILRSLRPAIIAMIASAGLSIFIFTVFGDQGFSFDFKSLNFIALALFLMSLFVLKKWRPNPMYIILGSGLIGGTIYLLLSYLTASMI